MCQYYRSLYQCGHDRAEVSECELVTIHGHRRCRPPPYFRPVTQPCGCRDGFLLGQVHRACRRNPSAEVRVQPYRLMEKIWTVSIEDMAVMSWRERRKLQISAGASLRADEDKDAYCLFTLPQEERLSENDVNVKRWADEEAEELEREATESKQRQIDAEAERNRRAQARVAEGAYWPGQREFLAERDRRLREREAEGSKWGGARESQAHQSQTQSIGGEGRREERDDGGENEPKKVDRTDGADSPKPEPRAPSFRGGWMVLKPAARSKGSNGRD